MQSLSHACPRPHPRSPAHHLYAKLLFRASTTTSGWGNFSLRGGPFLMPLHSSTAGEGKGGRVRGARAPPRRRPPIPWHSLLPSSFTRDTSKLFLRGCRGLMSTGRWAMAPRRAALTAAASRPNTRQLLLGRHGREVSGPPGGGDPRDTTPPPLHVGTRAGSPVLDNDAGAGPPRAALALGASPLLGGARLLRCLGRRRLLGPALPPAGSHPGRAAGTWQRRGRGYRGVALWGAGGGGGGPASGWGSRDPAVGGGVCAHGDPALGGGQERQIPADPHWHPAVGSGGPGDAGAGRGRGPGPVRGGKTARVPLPGNGAAAPPPTCCAAPTTCRDRGAPCRPPPLRRASWGGRGG